MRKSYCDAAGNEDDGIDKGQTPWPHRLGHRATRRHEQRPRFSKIRPQQQMGFQVIAGPCKPRDRNDASIEKCAEKGGKKHYFRNDKPEHPHSVGAVQLLTDHALQILFDDSCKPTEHHERDGGEADKEDRLAECTLGGNLLCALVNKIDSTIRGYEQRDRADDGPDTAVRNVITWCFVHV